jgi:hypothetical protein
LELSFADAKVQDLFSCRNALVREYGAALARKICCRLSVLAAAPSLASVPVGLPIGLDPTDDRGRFAVAVGPNHRLEFLALPISPSKEITAMPDLSRVSKLLIIGLVGVPIAKATRA